MATKKELGLCNVRGCRKPTVARGWCPAHYERWRRHGDPLTVRRASERPKKCYVCGGRGPFPVYGRKCRRCANLKREEWRQKNLEKSRKIARQSAMRRHRQRRQAVLSAYGRRCECCGETEEAFLVVDHINGGGNDHRRELGNGKIAGSSNFYRWLEKNSFPKDFQLLCHNCNFAKSNTPGGCPHRQELRKVA